MTAGSSCAAARAEHRLGEPLLGAEVVMQERRVDARLLRDLLRAGAGVPAAQEHDVRRVEDAPFRVAVVRPRRGPCRAAWGLCVAPVRRFR